MILRAQIPVDRRLTGSGVNGGVVLSDVVRKEIVELRKGMDLPGIDHREPAAADGAEVPFDLPFCSTVPHRRMGLDDAERIKDECELLILKGAAVIHVDLIGDPIGLYGAFEDLLVVVPVVVVEDFAADDQAGMVVDDHDEVGPVGMTVFGDVGEIAGIGLPHAPEKGHLIGFPVFDGGVPGRPQVVFLEKALYGADTDRGIDIPLLQEHGVDHDTVDPRVLLTKLVGRGDGIFAQLPGDALIGPRSRKESVHPVFPIDAGPAFQGIGTVLVLRSIRALQRLLSDSPIVGSFTLVGIEPLDHRSNQGKLEVSGFDRADQFLSF